MANHKMFQLGIKGLITNNEGKILLLKKSPNRSEKYGRNTDWDFPGGRIEQDSIIEETLNKEIKEETGIEKFENKGFFYTVISNYWFKDLDCGLILFIYEILPVGKYTVRLNDENTKYGWFEPNKAAELLKTKYPVELAEKVKTLAKSS